MDLYRYINKVYNLVKWLLRNCTHILYPNRFIIGVKGFNNGSKLDLNNCFDFQVIIYSVPLSFFNFDVSNTSW